MMAAMAEAAMVCSCGIRITKAITNVIAAATAAIGIHTLTAVDALSSVGCIVDYLGMLTKLRDKTFDNGSTQDFIS
jgi:hypothetical protein